MLKNSQLVYYLNKQKAHCKESKRLKRVSKKLESKLSKLELIPDKGYNYNGLKSKMYSKSC